MQHASIQSVASFKTSFYSSLAPKLHLLFFYNPPETFIFLQLKLSGYSLTLPIPHLFSVTFLFESLFNHVLPDPLWLSMWHFEGNIPLHLSPAALFPSESCHALQQFRDKQLRHRLGLGNRDLWPVGPQVINNHSVPIIVNCINFHVLALRDPSSRCSGFFRVVPSPPRPYP